MSAQSIATSSEISNALVPPKLHFWANGSFFEIETPSSPSTDAAKGDDDARSSDGLSSRDGGCQIRRRGFVLWWIVIDDFDACVGACNCVSAEHTYVITIVDFLHRPRPPLSLITFPCGSSFVYLKWVFLIIVAPSFDFFETPNPFYFLAESAPLCFLAGPLYGFGGLLDHETNTYLQFIQIQKQVENFWGISSNLKKKSKKFEEVSRSFSQ